jgi:hypothetical protein
LSPVKASRQSASDGCVGTSFHRVAILVRRL